MAVLQGIIAILAICVPFSVHRVNEGHVRSPHFWICCVGLVLSHDPRLRNAGRGEKHSSKLFPAAAGARNVSLLFSSSSRSLALSFDLR
jgi:hypothetical protein